ncbi:MAG: glycogen synthase, partial [Longimicrobiales bacterium]|nr:glycogen synthase [Longimicrobiales bacterium]
DRRLDVEVHAFGGPRDDDLVAAAYRPWPALRGEAPHRAAMETFSVDLAMAAGVEGADVVHSHTWYANLAGHLAKLTYGVPHVMTSHSLEPLRPWKAEQLGGGYQLSLWAERTAAESADAVIAVSAGMRDDVLEAYPGVDPGRVHVIHNGVDPAVYRPVEETAALEQLGVDPDVPTTVFVGRITRQKGLPHLLDAAEHLLEGSQLVLLAGAPDTPQIGREVEAAVDRLRAAGRLAVVWVPEMLAREKVVQVLSHATVFVCPSIYEPFGLVNVEAMACATPVVASAVGGIPEIVTEGETGHLVAFESGDDAFGSPADPAGFAAALADRINALLEDPAEARRMGRAARARVEAEFAWPAIADRTAALYRSLV